MQDVVLQKRPGAASDFTVSAGLKETTEKLVKKKLEGRDQLTPWEEFLQKKKQKKKQKRSGKQQVGWTEVLESAHPPVESRSSPPVRQRNHVD